jgi:phage terminase large subunit
LDAEQLYWYLNKYEKYLNKDHIKQEYPCTPREAFLLSGRNVFDMEALLQRLSKAPKPMKVGYFRYKYDGLKITDIQWVSDKAGFIRIYQLPNSPAVTKYCIGGDTAGSDSGEDYFTAHVLDARTGNQVAVLKHRFDSDQYAKQVYCLGVYYKMALVGIEANFDSFPIKELQRLGYPNQYVRVTQDSYTGKMEKRFGFKTTSITRPTVINRLVEIVRDHTELLNDRDTIEELMQIVRTEKGRIEAPQGGHDDQMMGLAIAHEIREQVIFPEDPIEVVARKDFDIQREAETWQEQGGTLPVV